MTVASNHLPCSTTINTHRRVPKGALLPRMLRHALCSSIPAQGSPRCQPLTKKAEKRHRSLPFKLPQNVEPFQPKSLRPTSQNCGQRGSRKAFSTVRTLCSSQVGSQLAGSPCLAVAARSPTLITKPGTAVRRRATRTHRSALQRHAPNTSWLQGRNTWPTPLARILQSPGTRNKVLCRCLTRPVACTSALEPATQSPAPSLRLHGPPGCRCGLPARPGAPSAPRKWPPKSVG